MARIIGVVVQNVCAWRIPSIPAPPPPTVTRKSLFKLGNCFRVEQSTAAPLSVLRGDPSDGDDPERMGGEFFLPEEKPIAAVGGSSAWSQLAAALKGGAALLWEQPGYCWLPSAWLDSPLNPLTNVSAGPIHLKLLDSKISPIHIQSPKDHLPSLISNCPENQTSYTKT